MPLNVVPPLTLAKAAKEIKAKRLSPVELTKAMLDRSYALNSTVNAYITISAESAIHDAQRAESEIIHGNYIGPLHGIPIALKDLYETKGILTTAGSKILSDWIPQHDSAVVSKLKDAGAVSLGKLNMHEFAYGVTTINPHYGPSRNPWNLNHITGGSSGGSGAAVAAGMCIASLGSDTGGSIRIPSCLCGIVGIKPTYGRVSRRGMLPLSWSLDHAGPMAQTAEDAAIMLNAIAGYDPEDASSLNSPVPDYTSFLTGDIKGVHLGILSGIIRQPVDHEIETSLINALHTLEHLGVELHEGVEISQLELARQANNTILMAEAAFIHQQWLPAKRGSYGEDVLHRLDSGAQLSASHYIRALKLGQKLRKELLSVLESVNVLFLPMIPMSAPSITDAETHSGDAYGTYDDLRSALTHFCGAFNLTGLPAISIPCGFKSDGLPIGFQLIGRPMDEGMLLRIADAYE